MHCHNKTTRKDCDKDASIASDSDSLAVVLCAITCVDGLVVSCNHSKEVLQGGEEEGGTDRPNIRNQNSKTTAATMLSTRLRIKSHRFLL